MVFFWLLNVEYARTMAAKNDSISPAIIIFVTYSIIAYSWDWDFINCVSGGIDNPRPLFGTPGGIVGLLKQNHNAGRRLDESKTSFGFILGFYSVRTLRVLIPPGILDN